jgi:hypothetical protein
MMPRINLPPGCAGFADGNTKYMAENGPGSYVNIDDTDPMGKRALRKLKSQDYASAGLVDAGPEKFIVSPKKGTEGRWCRPCIRSYHGWTKECPKCGGETILESELVLPKLDKYII